MRVALLLVGLAACGDRSSTAPPPAPVVAPVAPVAPPPKARPPRGEHEVDGTGYGKIAIGTPAAELAALGLSSDGAPGSGSFIQDGKSVGTVRIGSTVRIARGGVDLVAVEIEPARMSAFSIVVTDPLATTRDGIHVGATEAELTTAYGAPEDTYARGGYGLCRQYAKEPGLDFCNGSFVIPALRKAPLALGEDLGAIGKALEGHVIGGDVMHDGHLGTSEVTLIAPCLLAIHDDHGTGTHAVIAHGGAVYDSPGGWRRADGSVVTCTGTDASVFEIDPAGHGTRWVFDFDGRFRPEPAVCSGVDCRGVTEMTDGFTGWVRADLPGDLVQPGDMAPALERRRAIRAGGVPSDACDRNLARAWDDMAPARAALGLPSDDTARLAFLDGRNGHDYIGDCLVPRGMVPKLPGVDYVPHPPARAAYPATERRARERALVGTWRLDDHYRTTWTFTANGEYRLALDLEGAGGHGRYALVRPGQIELGSGGGTYRFAQGADRIFIDRDGITCPLDPTHVDLQFWGGLLLIRGDTCSVITDRGKLVPTRCTRAADGAAVTVPFTDDDGRTRQIDLAWIDGCYVDSTAKPAKRVSAK